MGAVGPLFSSGQSFGDKHFSHLSCNHNSFPPSAQVGFHPKSGLSAKDFPSPPFPARPMPLSHGGDGVLTPADNSSTSYRFFFFFFIYRCDRWQVGVAFLPFF